jgi:hypothetical protein
MHDKSVNFQPLQAGLGPHLQNILLDRLLDHFLFPETKVSVVNHCRCIGILGLGVRSDFLICYMADTTV